MKMILAFLLIALTVSATLSSVPTQKSVKDSGWSANVLSQPGHEAMCSVGLPLTKPSVLGAVNTPNCAIYVSQLPERWSDPKVPPRALKGEFVSGFIFSGWMEDGKAKIVIWALVNAQDATFASTEDKDLTRQLVDTIFIEPGKRMMINELRQYGAKPIELSIARTKYLVH